MVLPRLLRPDPQDDQPPRDSDSEQGWRRSRVAPSLQEVYRSVPIDARSFFGKLLAFAGPGYLVAVGYMDPGNWATDLAGGSRFGYTLLSVVLLSNIMAVLLQGLASKLGIVTGRDLAQACRDHYSKPTAIALWILCEIAIAACDLAEVIGSAIALNLLFHLPIAVGVLVTGFDVLLLLALQNRGVRVLEALVITLIATVGLCFMFEIILAHPNVGQLAKGFVPSTAIISDPEMLYIAIGILGATVMPHNLYLHSSIVQTRRYAETSEGRREAVRFAFLDSTIALSFAFFVNAAILIVAAATFHTSGHAEVAEIQDAHKLLTPLLGAGASTAFALALLASGQNSTAHRHARRPDRDGGLPQHPAASLAPPIDHARDRHCPGRHRRHFLRRQRHRTVAHPQPGDSEPPALVRGLSARVVHVRSRQDGRVRERIVAQGHRVGAPR